MNEVPSYWFPAKRYGWGWGAPTTWQGWVVLLVFTAALLLGGHWLLPGFGEVIFIGYAVMLSSVLLAVCWLKGEPPRWRWGKD